MIKVCACFLGLTLAVAGSAYARSDAGVSKSEALPLRIQQDAEGLELPYVELKVQGESRWFLLDTGAASTEVGDDGLSRGMSAVAEEQSQGVSGIAQTCSQVRVDSLQLGSTELGPRTIRRCEHYLVGIDVLGMRSFTVDLRRGEWRTPVQVAGPVRVPGVKRLARGHVGLSVGWGKVSAPAVFDTGANITVADLTFVKAHPEAFEFLRPDHGEDANGQGIDSAVYRALKMRVGTWTLRNVDVSAFPFPPTLQKDLEGAPVILGTNVIKRGIWSFDLEARQGRVQPVP